MQKFLLCVVALQFVLATVIVQPVSISTATQFPICEELDKFSATMTIKAAQALVPVGISLAPVAAVPRDAALRGLPANLTAGAYVESGIASIYTDSITANGEDANDNALTAAHRTLPFGTRVRVTNRINGMSVVVRINDRGPFIAGRVVDLTPAGARAPGFAELVPVGISLAPVAAVPRDAALRGLPANLTAGAYVESGIASIYTDSITANGEDANGNALTAAHRTLPFGTRVRVTNRINGMSVVVRINDRGPFIAGRVIDLTPAGARALSFSGLAPVNLVLAAHER